MSIPTSPPGSPPVPGAGLTPTPIPTIEDLRNAANLQAGIGGQVLAASLVLSGIFISFFDLRDISFSSLAGVLLSIAILLLFLSIIVGALGMKILRDNGGKSGDWDYAKTHFNFRVQTYSTFVAIGLFLIVFCLPAHKPEKEKVLYEINHRLQVLVTIDSTILANEALPGKGPAAGPEKRERVEGAERPEKAEKAAKPERPEKQEQPER